MMNAGGRKEGRREGRKEGMKGCTYVIHITLNDICAHTHASV